MCIQVSVDAGENVSPWAQVHLSWAVDSPHADLLSQIDSSWGARSGCRGEGRPSHSLGELQDSPQEGSLARGFPGSPATTVVAELAYKRASEAALPFQR
jgi:hypothetical protein